MDHKQIKDEKTNPLEKRSIELQNEIEGRIKALELEADVPHAGGQGCNADLCLADPITNQLIPIVPNIDELPSSETLFMPNGNLVYSDGNGYI